MQIGGNGTKVSIWNFFYRQQNAASTDEGRRACEHSFFSIVSVTFIGDG